ncbi:CBS domain-containing protein [Ancylothrix sp. C2]|uniref:CBS domain-containing protein n=1 Tax=Ancylothrix sp. D3o TaxID=2953691 RepID=UPI0021BA5134|nr:CBS domain-containing protein [Ancylothrix sp. D3o]MCT7948857.1 CBS domain-containing protein [Ancylothrix sp. D3o]
MDLILCHTTADFDTLGAAVGLTRLRPGARVVLTGGAHPTVRDFLALHRDEYPLIERRSVNPQKIRSIFVVDSQQRERLGKAAEWLDLPEVTEISVYDHHLHLETDIPATFTQIEPVGSTTTLIVELLQQSDTSTLTPAEATVMALGIHVDTGSLTFDHSTSRDAKALAWLMEKGASLPVIAEYVEPGLSPQLQDLLSSALEKIQTENVRGYDVSSVLLETDSYIPGLSSLASQLTEITEIDALLFAHKYALRGSGEHRLSVIGRSQIPNTNLNDLFKPYGGGGHARAASLVMRDVDAKSTLKELVEKFKKQIPHPPTARELMSSPVRTILPETTIFEAQRILLRYGHSGLSVVDATGSLVGVISRRDLDIALHHGFTHAPVKGYMTTNLKTITPDTALPEIEALMVTYDIGRLPVLENSQLVGIVTRTDVLRELHQNETIGNRDRVKTPDYCAVPQSLQEQLRNRMTPQLWHFLKTAGELAENRGWQLYLVGGAVRDLLLAKPDDILELSDIDLVVDGYYKPEALSGNLDKRQSGAGVQLAKALQERFPQARLDIHGKFQTAALLWHKDAELGSLWVDIATARTEFYPYPAANPEVEASSIRQDLYRRDFTINALAVKITGNRAGELLDFFGGLLDLQAREIRVLHANSFIEDPTRIYRAVRFAVRLGFEIEPQTKGYIRHAIESGVYHRHPTGTRAPALETRLKAELKYILQAPYWKSALQLLGELQALKCIHSTLELDDKLWKQVRLVDRCLQKFDAEKSLEHWQIMLEVLIAYLEPQYRLMVAETLQLPVPSIARLNELAKNQQEVKENLPQCQRVSEIVGVLRRYDLSSLILIAAGSKRRVRRVIWQYLTVGRQIKPPLNGNDLKQLGYKQGRQFKQILDELLAARLDGEIGDSRAGAEQFLAWRYPLS